MAKHRYSKGKKIKWGIAIAFVMIASLIMVFVSMLMQRNIAEPIESADNNIEQIQSYMDNSMLNGAAFSEKDVYNTYDDKKLYYGYITVLPTVDDKTNNKVTLTDLNNVTSVNQNPVVEVMFQEGTSEGPQMEIYDSTILRANATMKVRGYSSRTTSQKSFKVELSGVSNRFLGQDKLNFNKHFTDPLRVSNKFCMDAFEHIDDMGSLNTYFIKLYIRDMSSGLDTGFVDYGLFTMVEQPNKDYLRIHGLDRSGALYKAIDFSFSNNQTAIVSEDNPYYDKEAFERVLSVRENADHDKVVSMIDAVNDTRNNINEVVNTYFNRDNYLTWMATNIIFGNTDATANNFLLYSSVNSKTWYFLPWDYDKTLLYSKIAIEQNDFPASLYGLGNFWGIELHNRYFKDTKNIEDLNKRIEEIMENDLSVEDCNELTSEYRRIVEEAAFTLPDVAHLEITADEMVYYYDNMYDILRYYVDLYYENLERPMPIYMSPVVENNGTYFFEWDYSTDLQGDSVYYTLEVARDLDFDNIVYSAKDMLDINHSVELELEPDTYYYRVNLRDSKGNEQINLETYIDDFTGRWMTGISAFEVE